jgi:hypothetical protein
MLYDPERNVGPTKFDAAREYGEELIEPVS